MTERRELFQSFSESGEWWKTWQPVIRAGLLTVPLFVVAFLFVDATQIPLLLLFPYHPLALDHVSNRSVAALVIFAAYLVQYPVYAAFLRAGARVERLRATAAMIALLHLLAVGLAAHRSW